MKSRSDLTTEKQNPHSESIDLKSYLIDFSVLSAPTHFRYDCRKEEPYPCDEIVLDKIGYFENEGEEQDSSSSVWENLKRIKKRLMLKMK